MFRFHCFICYNRIIDVEKQMIYFLSSILHIYYNKWAIHVCVLSWNIWWVRDDGGPCNQWKRHCVYSPQRQKKGPPAIYSPNHPVAGCCSIGLQLLLMCIELVLGTKVEGIGEDTYHRVSTNLEIPMKFIFSPRKPGNRIEFYYISGVFWMKYQFFT